MRTKNNAISNFCYRHGNSTCNSRQYHCFNISSKRRQPPQRQAQAVKKQKALKPVREAVQQQQQVQAVKKQKALKPVREAVQQQQQQQQQVQAIVH